MLDTQGTDSPIPSNGPGSRQHFEALSTDFDRRGEIIVIASRKVHGQPRNQPPSKTTASKAKSKVPGSLDRDSSQDESEDDSDDCYSSDSEDEHSAYETCSEGSTDVDSEGDSTSDEESSESSEEEIDLEPEASDAEDEMEDTQRPTITVGYQKPVDDKVEIDSDVLKQKNSRPTYPGLPGRFRDPRDRITAEIKVYNVGAVEAVRLFHYDHDIPAMLYHSPPVLHPFKPLVVWPLGGGEVLFAAYAEKTYFLRAIMPSTRNS